MALYFVTVWPLASECTFFKCPSSQCVNEVYHEQEAASCVSGITWHVYLRLW